jgi:hypothetical protein
MKKILILLLTTSFISSNDNFTKSTLSILELQSSKVLSNFQGQMHDQSNSLMHAQSNDTINQTINPAYNESMLILHSGLELEIQQIDENTFEVVE